MRRWSACWRRYSGKCTDLRERLTQHLQKQRSTDLHDQPDVARLEAQREELKQQIAVIVQSLNGAALADAQTELKRLGDRRNAVEAMLEEAKGSKIKDTRPAQLVIDEAMRVLSEDSQKLLTLPIAPLREAVDRLVCDATVDMETKAVEFKIVLPTCALLPQKNAKKGQNPASGSATAMCPADNPRSQDDGWTHTIFATARCEYEWNRGSKTVPPCYRCRRIAA